MAKSHAILVPGARPAPRCPASHRRRAGRPGIAQGGSVRQLPRPTLPPATASRGRRPRGGCPPPRAAGADWL